MSDESNSYVAGSTNAPLERNQVIDNARGLGILLIMFGHAPGLPGSLSLWIYSFHVPLFFLLAGFSIKSDVLALRLPSMVSRLVKLLFVPYFFFWCISYFYWLPTRKLGGNAALYENFSNLTPLAALLRGDTTNLYINPALWFFSAMAAMTLMHWASQRITKTRVGFLLVLSLSYLAVMVSMRGQQIPLNVDIGLTCLPFFTVGHALKTALTVFDRIHLSTVQLSLLTLLLLFLTTILSNMNGAVDIIQRNYGRLPLLFFMCSFAGITMILTVSKILLPSRGLFFLSRNSLILFALHMVAYRIFTGVLIVIFHIPRSVIAWPIFALLYVAWSLTVLYPTIHFLKKYMPTLVAVRRPVHPR